MLDMFQNASALHHLNNWLIMNIDLSAQAAAIILNHSTQMLSLLLTTALTCFLLHDNDIYCMFGPLCNPLQIILYNIPVL